MIKIIAKTGIIVLILFTGCTKEVDVPEENNLIPVLTFANGDDDFVVNPTKIVSDRNNYLFINDVIPAQIKKFSLEGELLSVIGSVGQGPDQYLSPVTLEVFDGRVFVEDRGNLRIKIHSQDGDIEHIFNHQYPIAELTVHENAIFAFSTSHFINPNTDGRDLITVFDFEGNVTNTFGDYIDVVDELPSGMSWPMMKIENDLLHVVFRYFPIYRVYSLDGELLREFDLMPFFDPEMRGNYRSGAYSDPTSPNAQTAFGAFDIIGNEIYLSRVGERIQIEKYLINDDEIILDHTYIFDPGTDDSVFSIGFFYDENSHSFYALEYRNDMFQITKYEIDEDGS